MVDITTNRPFSLFSVLLSMSLLWCSFDPKLLNIQVDICINFALSKSALNFEENSKNLKNLS